MVLIGVNLMQMVMLMMLVIMWGLGVVLCKNGVIKGSTLAAMTRC